MMGLRRTFGTPLGRGLGLLLAILVLAPLGFVAWQRHQLESFQKTVAIVVDGYEVTPDLYPQMEAAGATGVALYEWTLQDVLDQGDVFLLSYDALWTVGSPLAQHLPPLSPGELYLGWQSADDPTKDGAPGIVAPSPWRSRIAERLRVSDDLPVDVLAGNVLRVDAPTGYEVWRVGPDAVASILRMPLGFSPEQIRAAGAAGLAIFPRILVGDGPFEGSIAERLATVATDAPILFRGTQVVDTNFGIELIDIMQTSQRPVGVIEFSPQIGLDQLVRFNGYRALRVHSITDREMASDHMTPARATERFMRSVHERSIRLLYVRLFPDERFDAAQNVRYVANLARELEMAGYTLGLPEPVAFPPASWLNLAAVGVAVLIAGGVAGIAVHVVGGLGGFVDGFVWRRLSLPIWIIVGAFGASCVFWFLWLKGYTVLARQVVALGAALVFPVVAIAAAVYDRGLIGASRHDAGHPLWRAIRSFLVATLITLVGVLVLVALLDDPRFMLKVEEFRGVKLAHIAPPLIILAWLFVLSIVSGVERGSWFTLMRRLLTTRVSVSQLIVAGVACALMGFYVLRTGNEGAPVLWIETAFRRLLEENLWVRPRTKEFLIGHPALFLALYFGPQLGTKRAFSYSEDVPDGKGPILLALMLAGTIGQLSILNTFAHVHVPLIVSVIRTLLGLGLGLVLGMVALLVVKLLRFVFAAGVGSARSGRPDIKRAG